MSVPSISAAVREAINGDVNVPAEDIVVLVRAAGVTASDSSIRDAIYNVKSGLRKKAQKPGVKAAKPVPAAARATKNAPPPPVATAITTIPAAPGSAPDLRAMLANVALVNDVLGTCGGADAARKVVEAVQACGGVEPFLLHLDLITRLRDSAT